MAYLNFSEPSSLGDRRKVAALPSPRCARCAGPHPELLGGKLKTTSQSTKGMVDMNEVKTELRAEVLGRITRAPQLRHTSGGTAVCRFAVATDTGPATNPVVKSIYVLGDPTVRPSEDLAVRCTHLRVGDLVYVPGVERQRIRAGRGVSECESAILADDVRLRARAGESS